MKAMWKAVSLLAVAVALPLSCSHAFARGGGGGGPVHVSGTSAAPSPTGSSAGGGQSKVPLRPCVGHQHTVNCGRPGTTLPTCRGGHMGPNGVMIQCK